MGTALSAIQLGKFSLSDTIRRSGIDPSAIESVTLGNVLSAGLGQAPARQVAIASGLSATTVCTTINKVCSSGLKAVSYASQSIALGE